MENKFQSLAVGWGIIAAVLLFGAGTPGLEAQPAVPLSTFKTDPYWPKPLPQAKDANGQLRRWVSGQIGSVCVDSHDHVFTTNRGGSMGRYEGMSGMLAPEVVVYDSAGDVIDSWGEWPREGESKILPQTAHGCFVDHEDNLWLSGLGDGIVQKWSHDGDKLLLQIGEKGKCDGEPNQNPKTRYPSCGEVAPYNRSQTLLNLPADVWVDPDSDPVTGQRGSVYIADGYGNPRGSRL